MRFTTNFLNSSSRYFNNILTIFKGLLLSVILLYFTSCVEEDLIGSSLQDEGILLNTFYSDTFTVESSIIYTDSVVTSGNLLVGVEEDEKFGKTYTESFFKLFVPAEYNESFIEANNDAIFDSARLVLSYSVISGDESKSQEFELYSINELINDTILYYQTDKIEDINNRIVGRGTLLPQDDSLNILSFEADAIGQSLFINRTSANMLEQVLFEENVFKGINIKPADSEADAYTLRFAPSSSSSINFLFRVYYSLPEDTLSRIQNFFIGTSFYSAEADFTSTPYLSGLQIGNTISTDNTENECYLQSGVGLTTIMKFPGLANFAQQNPNIAINKAELSFDPIESSQTQHGIPPETISFFVLDENGENDENVLLLEEGRSPESVSTFVNQNVPVLTLSYGSGSGTYPVADITSYVQDLISGAQPNNGIMINPFLRRGSISRCVFGDNNYGSNPLQLRIYYTKSATNN